MVKEAKQELPGLELGASSAKRYAREEQDIQNMIARMRAPAKPDAVAGTYEIKSDTFRNAPNLFISEDEDENMSDTEPRTQESVRTEVTHKLRDLVMRGGSELETYDSHTEDTMKIYKQALDRRRGHSRPSVTPTNSSTHLPKSILVNKSGERSTDKDPKKKKATFEK